MAKAKAKMYVRRQMYFGLLMDFAQRGEFMRYVVRFWIDIRIIYSELPVAPVGPWRKLGEFDYFRDYG
jgi:hypothetical protein